MSTPGHSLARADDVMSDVGVHTRAGAAMARMLELMSRIRTMPTTRGRTETAALGVFASTTAALLLGETLALERGYSEAVAASRKRSRPSSGSGSGSGNDDDGDVDPGAAVQAVNAYRTKLRSHGTSSGGNSGTSNDANTGPSGAAAAAASARLAAYTALLGGLDTPALAEIVAYFKQRFGDGTAPLFNALGSSSIALPLAPGALVKPVRPQQQQAQPKADVDRRASKGRRLKYVVHPKLVGFTAATPYAVEPDQAVDLDTIIAGLFKSSTASASTGSGR